MKRSRIEALLASVKAGKTPVESAVKQLESLPFEDLDFAVIDHHRALRVGVPEVIYGEGKTTAQILAIAEELCRKGQDVLATRLSEASAAALVAAYPSARHNALGRTVYMRLNADEAPPKDGLIVIVAAGTSDLPVVEEAYETALALGNRVEKVVDVGVAGIHRLFAKLEIIRRAKVVVVVAGMEGALASVVGGLVDKPVIAVPTSVGYGASFGGISALLTMLNSCSSGVTVVNIDNGFGAAYAASQINKL